MDTTFPSTVPLHPDPFPVVFGCFDLLFHHRIPQGLLRV